MDLHAMTSVAASANEMLSSPTHDSRDSNASSDDTTPLSSPPSEGSDPMESDDPHMTTTLNSKPILHSLTLNPQHHLHHHHPLHHARSLPGPVQVSFQPRKLKHNVSFHLDHDDPPHHHHHHHHHRHLLPPPSPSPSPGTPLRSALKPTASRYCKLPPSEQFEHPDPLLRRLRLVDANGKPVSLRQHFGSRVQCVGFYFSSEWAGQPLKQYDQLIADFSRRHSDEFKVVYVSIDVDEAWFNAGRKDKPWVSMVWDDGSDPTAHKNPLRKTRSLHSLHSLPSGSTTFAPQPGPPPQLLTRGQGHNGEDFLRDGEPDIDASLARTDTSGSAYLRPFSRVHLAHALHVTTAPTLTIYHAPSHRIIEWNVPSSRLRPGTDQTTWFQWHRGRSSSPWDKYAGRWLQSKPPPWMQQLPWGAIVLALLVSYWLAITLTS